ncbi:MAG: thioredoxin fold domain-containing protein [Rikenellaceae bacterium]
MLRKIIFSVALLLSVGFASAQVKFQDVSPEELLKMAESEDKLVFIDIYADWCPPCRAMESEVFSRKDVAEFMDARFVSAKYNMDKDTGKEIAARYNVRSIPTYLIFNDKGDFLGRLQGKMPAEDFMENINMALTK